MAPSLCPTSTASSTVLPSARAPRKPPAKASPAPFVSTIADSASLVTGYVLGEVERPDCAGSDDATMVESEPWVMTTRRGRDEFFFGSAASLVAISARSLVCERDG